MCRVQLVNMVSTDVLQDSRVVCIYLYIMAGHNGFLNDVSITFIDKTDPTDPLRREDYWRQTLKTVVSYGLNIEDSV